MSGRPGDCGVAVGPRSDRGRDAFDRLPDRLAGATDTSPERSGTLDRRPYEGTAAVVRDDRGVPPIRVWNDA